jgi:beta-lactamase class A
MADIGDSLRDLFDTVGVSGRVHARDVDDPTAEVAFRAAEPSVLASVVKIYLVLEYARQADAGQIDPAERVRVRSADQLGGAGTAGCQDEVEMSWRDLAWFAMALSDNTAADLLFRRIGIDNVRALATQCGLRETRIVGGPRDLVRSMFLDLGVEDETEFAKVFPGLRAHRVQSLSVLDPARTTAAPPHEVTRLLSMLWRDEAGSSAACSTVRALMRRQACWHRLAAAFDDSVTVAAKSGTLLNIRNEAGVVTYPDGRRYAVAVFTAGADGVRRTDVDRVIGDAARLAVEALRR